MTNLLEKIIDSPLILIICIEILSINPIFQPFNILWNEIVATHMNILIIDNISNDNGHFYACT